MSEETRFLAFLQPTKETGFLVPDKTFRIGSKLRLMNEGEMGRQGDGKRARCTFNVYPITLSPHVHKGKCPRREISRLDKVMR